MKFMMGRLPGKGAHMPSAQRKWMAALIAIILPEVQVRVPKSTKVELTTWEATLALPPT